MRVSWVHWAVTWRVFSAKFQSQQRSFVARGQGLQINRRQDETTRPRGGGEGKTPPSFAPRRRGPSSPSPSPSSSSSSSRGRGLTARPRQPGSPAAPTARPGRGPRPSPTVAGNGGGRAGGHLPFSTRGPSRSLRQPAEQTAQAPRRPPRAPGTPRDPRPNPGTGARARALQRRRLTFLRGVHLA
jgi:hypothetical protein